jgi:uncharacterized protein YbjQ (UPF0145 family)
MRTPRLCSNCRASHPELLVTDYAKEQQRLSELLATFPLYTTPVPGNFTTKGIVSGTAVMGANIVRDMFASITDVVGGRSGKYQAVIARGRDIALAEMCDEAQKRGASLIAGVRVEVDTLNNGMFVISATGTALVASDEA